MDRSNTSDQSSNAQGTGSGVRTLELTYCDSAACHRQRIQVAMLCAECDGGQYANDQGTAVGGCAGCLPCFEDGCSRHHLPAEKCGRRCSSTDASTWQDGLVAILRNALCKDTGRKYRPLFSLLLFSLAKSLTRLEELRDERNLRPKVGSPTPLHYPLESASLSNSGTRLLH